MTDLQDDPIWWHLEREDRYWREQGGRDESVTAKVGFTERWETMEDTE